MSTGRLGPPAGTVSTLLCPGDLEPAWRSPRAARQKPVRLGVPNTGRLRDWASTLIDHAFGLDTGPSKRLRFQPSPELEIVRARSTDLPHLLAHRVVDVALTGSDYCFEAGVEAAVLSDLQLICGQVCLLTASGAPPPPGSAPRVATQYPRHAGAAAKALGISATIAVVTGAGELYPQLDLADASVDCVVTGRTCAENGLRIAVVIRPVFTGLFARSDAPPGERAAQERLAASILAVRTRPELAAAFATEAPLDHVTRALRRSVPG